MAERADAPVISLVTVCFNAAATIAATLESVAQQKTDEIEYIVIDGASRDATPAIVQRFEHVVDQFVSEPDKGIYDAWNKGLGRAKGNYVAFIGADDVLLPGALKAYVDYVRQHPDVDYVSARARYGRRIIGTPFEWRKFSRYMNVAHVGSLHARRLFDAFGAFDTSYRIVGDYEFLLRAGPSLRAGFIDRVTVDMGVEGVSSGRAGAVFAETMRAKVERGARSPIEARLDRLVAEAKFGARRLLGKLS